MDYRLFAGELHRDGRKVCMIISTVNTGNVFLFAAYELDVVRYLVKPITRSEFIGALSKDHNELP